MARWISGGPRVCGLVLTMAVGLAIATEPHAAVVDLPASKDNSLFEDCPFSCPDGASNGAGEYSFNGATAFFGLRRGLLAFDVAAEIPQGSSINAATLTLHDSTPGRTGAVTVSLHRLTADWGEGVSDAGTPGGGGALPTPNDADWIHRFHSGTFWTSPGGDFEGVASDSQVINAKEVYYVWGSTPTMVSDVQSWLDSPATNFGWIVLGDEAGRGSARRFDTRENGTPSFRPVLTVDYDSPFDPLPVAVDIKPGSDPNTINLGHAGVVPVAILGSEDFDVLTVDPTTVCFGADPTDPSRSDCAESHDKGHYDEDVNEDGELDLLMHFDNRETWIALGDTEACLTGETLDGESFLGCDFVRGKFKCGIGFELAFILPPLMWLRGRRRRGGG